MPVAEDQLTTMFTALADPTRRAIVGRLALGDATVTELTDLTALTQQAVSKHLKVLEQAGLVWGSFAVICMLLTVLLAWRALRSR